MLLGSKKLLFAMMGGGTLLLGALGLSSFSLSSQLSYHSQLKDGLDVCFNRVVETVKGQAVGLTEVTSGPYTQLTEECFADLKDMLALGKGKFFSQKVSEFNQVMTDVYWLHKAGSDLEKSKEIFEKVDAFHLDFAKQMANRQEGLTNSLSYLKLGISAIFLAVVAVFAAEFARRRRIALIQEAHELTAWELRQKQLVEATRQRASLLLQEALEFNQLKECSKLCGDLIAKQEEELARLSEEREIVVEMEPELEIEVEWEEDLINNKWTDDFLPSHDIHHLRENTISKIYVAKEEAPVASVGERISGIDLEISLNQLLDHLQPKLNQNRIFVDIQGKPNLSVAVVQEELIQIFSALLNNAIKRLKDLPGAKTLMIAFDQNPGRAEVHLFDNGVPLFLEDMNLILAQELTKEAGGEFLWENSVDYGRHIVCALPLATAPQSTSARRTTSITKTTKKELLRQMAEARC